MPPEDLMLYGSIATGVAVASLVWVVLGLLSVPRAAGELGVFEFKRRIRLREGSQLYRWFEPWIDPLARQLGGGAPAPLAQLRRNLSLAGNPLPWKPEEFLAAKYVEGMLVGVAALFVTIALTMSPVTGLLVGGCIAAAYVPLVRRQVQKRADARLKLIRRRLPFVMDLTALTMEAGASFLESLAIVVRENEKHPLGEQLAEVLRDISVGRTRREALEALQQRLSDEDVSEIVFAIIKGEELGTPLGQILRNQADQMRLKRSQWAEKAAAEAQVSIVFPGMVIMVACLLVVAAPFVLSAMYAR
jgi:tight adherence protein C